MSVSLDYQLLAATPSFTKSDKTILTTDKTTDVFQQKMDSEAAYRSQQNALEQKFFALCREDKERLISLTDSQAKKIGGWFSVMTQESLLRHVREYLLAQPIQWGLTGKSIGFPCRDLIDPDEVELREDSCIEEFCIKKMRILCQFF